MHQKTTVYTYAITLLPEMLYVLRETYIFTFGLPVEEVAVIWINKAICCLSDMGVFELGLAGVTPVLNPIPFGLGGGIIPKFNSKREN